uniref:PASTA domain-containing protein n=1 Tax=Stomatohabitans albus TaxID=3110766 RepID=UPI00300CCEE2
MRFLNATQQVEVPDIAGKSFQDAQTLLLEQQLQPALGESKSSDTIEANHVISTDPLAGTKVDRGSNVTMILSSGPDTVPIPALSRMTRAQAEEILKQLDLKVGNVTREPDPKIARGLIVSSQPAAGTSVKRGTSINLVVSSGGQSFTVPDLKGLTELAAREALAKVCGSPTCVRIVVETDEDSTGDGRVLSSDPAAGEELQEGETITLTVSRIRSDSVVEEPTSSSSPSSSPSAKPTASEKPSAKPSESEKPSAKPTASEKPSAKPTPTTKPTAKPTTRPSPRPSPRPTGGGGEGGPIDVAPPTPIPGG